MDSLELESVVLTIEVSAFQGLHYDKAQRIIWFQWYVSLLLECPQLQGLD